MTSYTFPIKMALLIFPFLAFAITVPFLIYYYRRYGTLGKKRSLILYSFVFYLLCAYFLVILPLPPRSAVAQLTGPRYELRLFHSLQEFLTQTVFRPSQPATYLPALKQSVFLEPVFNLLLLFPFGIYCRYYFKLTYKQTIGASFLLSLFFELTQLSGLYFIYPRPYRLFDVNDLLHNTLGGLLGFIFEPLFVFFLPSRDDLDQEAWVKGRHVSVLRRSIASVIDWSVIGVASTFVTLLLATFHLDLAVNEVTSFGWFLLEVALYFVGVTYVTGGTTVGKKIVRIKVTAQNGQRVSLKKLVIRYGFFYGMLGVTLRLFNFTLTHLTVPNHTVMLAYLLILLLSLAILLLFGFNLLYAQLRRKDRLFHEKASQTMTISTVVSRSGKSEKEGNYVI